MNGWWNLVVLVVKMDGEGGDERRVEEGDG